MAIVDYQTREINYKISYVGPSMGGKLMNFSYLHNWSKANCEEGFSSKGIVYNTSDLGEHIYFFDFIPNKKYFIHGFRVRFHLYCVHSTLFLYKTLYKALKGSGGIVFVADSQCERLEPNLESFFLFNKFLTEANLDLAKMPYVLQLNKRDLPGIYSVKELVGKLRCKDEPVIEAVAMQGIGVLETFNEIAKQVYSYLESMDISKYPSKQDLSKNHTDK